MIRRRVVASLTLICLVICLQGCYSNRLIPPEEAEQYPDYRVARVVTADGEVIEFHPDAFVSVDEISGISREGASVEIPLSQVKMLHIKKFEKGQTIGWVVVIPLGGFLFAMWVIDYVGGH
jgi:hypothetical protein